MELLREFIAEIIGTFVFLSVIITNVNFGKINPSDQAWIRISLGLGISILLVGYISGAHLNPAVSFMFYLNKDLSLQGLFTYVVAQLIGATCALGFYLFGREYLKIHRKL